MPSINYIHEPLICKFAFLTVCPTICDQIVDPVCGSDNVTYANHCELGKADCLAKYYAKRNSTFPEKSNANISFAYNGPCIETPGKLLSFVA